MTPRGATPRELTGHSQDIGNAVKGRAKLATQQVSVSTFFGKGRRGSQ